MNSDNSYRTTALFDRGQFAENATADLLAKVFGALNVYIDVEIKESKGRTLTDIDVLAVVGNKAVIAQVKSKRLTELAKLACLIADFKLAVQEAYDQGLLFQIEQIVSSRLTKKYIAARGLTMLTSLA